MKNGKGSKKRSIYSKGELNRIVDDLVHPFFKKGKEFILVDGILHGVIEQNPSLSVKKFMTYSFPELLKSHKTKQIRSGMRKRHYRCKIPVESRFFYCEYKKAGSWCLLKSVGRMKCQHLTITYE